jgi:beta-lactamase regulating signal transducer with metallopeptidase domain
LTATVILPLAAVAAAVALTVAIAVPRSLERLLSRRSYAGPVLWAGAVMAPLVIAVLVVAALLLPAPIGSCHCAVHAPHHPHLCLAHPELAASLMLPAALLLLIWASLVAPRLWRVVADVRRTRRWVREACEQLVSVDGIRVWLGRCGAPIALSAGAFQPRIIFDRGLWSRLKEDERRAVVHHEHAHVLRGDGLTLLGLRVAAALHVVRFAAGCLEKWRAAAEVECDRHASAAVGDPLTVASALLTVERGCQASMHAAPDGLLAARPGALLELRVRSLLEPARRAPRLANDLLLIGCALCTAAFVVLVWPSDAVHHGLETLIGSAFR